MNPGEVSCTEGVALVTGGYSRSKTNSPMEVYGSGGMRIMLGLLPFYMYNHRSLYTGNFTLMCGGIHTKKKARFKCFKLMFKLDGKRSGEILFPQMHPDFSIF